MFNRVDYTYIPGKNCLLIFGNNEFLEEFIRFLQENSDD